MPFCMFFCFQRPSLNSERLRGWTRKRPRRRSIRDFEGGSKIPFERTPTESALGERTGATSADAREEAHDEGPERTRGTPQSSFFAELRSGGTNSLAQIKSERCPADPRRHRTTTFEPTPNASHSTWFVPAQGLVGDPSSTNALSILAARPENAPFAICGMPSLLRRPGGPSDATTAQGASWVKRCNLPRFVTLLPRVRLVGWVYWVGGGGGGTTYSKTYTHIHIDLYTQICRYAHMYKYIHADIHIDVTTHKNIRKHIHRYTYLYV